MEDKPDWWIKATDRLPQHQVIHHLKIHKNAMFYLGYYDHSLKRFMCPNLGPQGVKIEDVQWLDENVITSLQSELSSAQEKNTRLNILLDIAYKMLQTEQTSLDFKLSTVPNIDYERLLIDFLDGYNKINGLISEIENKKV